MATYKKKLLDANGNVILPYTRAELVYNGNATIADQISTLSTNYTNLLNALNQLKTDLKSEAFIPSTCGWAYGVKLHQSGANPIYQPSNGTFVCDGNPASIKYTYIWNLTGNKAMYYPLT